MDRRYASARHDPGGKHAAGGARRTARLPLRAALPRGRGPEPRAHRRGRRRARGVPPRRAHLVVPVAQGDPARARRRLSLPGARPRGLRALGQAHRHRLLQLRPPHRACGHAAGGPRPARRDRRGARLGRDHRPAPGGGAARARRAPGDPRHRAVHRAPAHDRRVDRIPRLRRAHRGPARRHARARRLQERPRRGGHRGLRRALPRRRVQGRRARVPADDPAQPRGARRHRRAAGAGGAARGPPPHADAVGRLGRRAAAVGSRALRRRHRPRAAARDRGRRPRPAGGPGAADRPADRRLAQRRLFAGAAGGRAAPLTRRRPG